MTFSGGSGGESHRQSTTVVCEIPQARTVPFPGEGDPRRATAGAGSAAFPRSGACSSRRQLLTARRDSVSSQGPSALLLALQVGAGAGPLPSVAHGLPWISWLKQLDTQSIALRYFQTRLLTC